MTTSKQKGFASPAAKVSTPSGKPRRPKNILLTGVRSFPGAAILRWLEADPRYPNVVAVDIKKPRFPFKKAKFYKVDFTEPTADAALARIMRRERIDTVVHAAAFFYPHQSNSYAHEVEVIGTLHLLHAARSCKIRKLIVASTTEVYGALSSNPNFLTEEMPLRGKMNYGYIRNKIEMEKETRLFKTKNPDTVVTVLRTCTVLGDHVKNTATQFLSLPVIYTILGFDPLMQFIWEDDALAAYQLAIENDYDGVFNIVGEGVLPLSTLSKLAGKITLPVVKAMVGPLFGFLWQFKLTVAPPPHMDYIRFIWVADGAKAQRVMGFKPQISTRDAFLRFMGQQRLYKYHPKPEETGEEKTEGELA